MRATDSRDDERLSDAREGRARSEVPEGRMRGTLRGNVAKAAPLTLLRYAKLSLSPQAGRGSPAARLSFLLPACGEKVPKGRMRGAFPTADRALNRYQQQLNHRKVAATSNRRESFMRGKQDHSRQRTLRHDQTEAEYLLWQQLRNRRLMGQRFRRQHKIGPFFVDFVCPAALLVVELDGSQHLDRIGYDASRSKYLNQCGYRVLRFWNHDVMCRKEDVLAEILRALSAT